MNICKDCAFSEFCAESGKPNAWTSDAANAGEMAEEMEYEAEYLSTPCFWFSFDSAGYGRHLQRVAMRLRTIQASASKWREALEGIAHYCDDRYRMDDYCCADGHICAEIAKKALEGEKS